VYKFFLCLTVFEIPTKLTRLNNEFAMDVKEIQVELQNLWTAWMRDIVPRTS